MIHSAIAHVPFGVMMVYSLTSVIGAVAVRCTRVDGFAQAGFFGSRPLLSHGPYPDHFYLYTGAFNSFHYAATRPPEWPPGQVGRYRNTDPVLVNYLIRLAVEKRHGDYLAFPQRALFDKIGVRSMVIETDPYGDFLTQGYDLGAARDWARLGNLYLQEGRWNGVQLLPPNYARFVRTLAPAWLADGRPIYGGFFWVNGDSAFPVPKDAYYMSGAGGQYTMIIPSHDLVVVRLGHYKGPIRGTLTSHVHSRCWSRRSRGAFVGIACVRLSVVLACSGGAKQETGTASVEAHMDREHVLNVYNWFDYIDRSIIPDFEKEYGLHVNYDVFDADEVLDTKLLTGHSQRTTHHSELRG